MYQEIMTRAEIKSPDTYPAEPSRCPCCRALFKITVEISVSISSSRGGPEGTLREEGSVEYEWVAAGASARDQITKDSGRQANAWDR